MTPTTPTRTDTTPETGNGNRRFVRAAIAERRDYTLIHWDAGRVAHALEHTHSDDHTFITERERCPFCGAMAVSHDDGERSWLVCPGVAA